MSQYAVHAEGISRSYGERLALDNVTLAIPAGSVFGLLGPNGSGKSTFIAMLAAMESPGAGSLRIFGEEPGRGLLSRVGFVFQENTADPLMRVNEYLKLAGRLFGMSSGDIAERSRELLATFGLIERAGEPISTLSGGMRRRLEAARALLHRPELLILDEPTTGIDPEERQKLWSALRADSGERTVILSTNDLAEADAICTEVAFLREGKVIATGTPSALKAGLRRDSVAVTWPGHSAAQVAAVESWPGTGAVVEDGEVVTATVDEASTFVPRLFEFAPGEITAIKLAPATLEDAYFQLVRKQGVSL